MINPQWHNNPYLEQIFMVPRLFELLRFDYLVDLCKFLQGRICFCFPPQLLPFEKGSAQKGKVAHTGSKIFPFRVYPEGVSIHIKVNTTQQAHDIYTSSAQRRCNVMTFDATS